MPGFFFYMFIGFASALIADYGKSLGPGVFVVLAVFNLASLGMYLYAARMRRQAGPGDEIRPVAGQFLILAPICYVLGVALALTLRVY